MYEPSEYQKAIVDAVKNDKGNLLINAKAGSGKTSTLIMISDELTAAGNKSLFLAFNKTVAEELSEKLASNPNVTVRTINALGYSFILSDLYRRYGRDGYNYKVLGDGVVTKKLVKNYIDTYYLQDIMDAKQDIAMDRRAFKDLYDNIVDDFIGLINFTRYYFINFNDETAIQKLMNNEAAKFTYNLTPSNGIKSVFPLVQNVIQTRLDTYLNPEPGEDGKPFVELDYIDQIYFPVYFRLRVPYKYRDFLDYIEVDESQDLSILQQRLLQMLDNGKTRYIFVGDEKQAIYGFAGADTHSIDNVKFNFILKNLPLNICYRCPEKVVKLAQEIVPDIEFNKDRPDKGDIEVCPEDVLTEKLVPGDLVICRTNDRLLKLFTELSLKQHKKVKFKNNKIVKGIIRDIRDVTTKYISKYNQCMNIEAALDEFLTESNISTHKDDRTPEEEKRVAEKVKELVEINKSVPKVVKKRNFSLLYLITAMQEYNENGSYRFAGSFRYPQYIDDVNMVCYYDTLLSFMEVYIKFNYGASKSLASCIEKDRQILDDILTDEFLTYVESFLLAQGDGGTSRDCPILSSIHQMKGGEADNVYIMDYPLLPYIKKGVQMTEEDKIQEKNLKYVAITRAKKSLKLVVPNPFSFSADKIDEVMDKNRDFLSFLTSQFKNDFAKIDPKCYEYCVLNNKKDTSNIDIIKNIMV